MQKLDTESKMDFDLVADEDRFALRHFIEQLTESINYSDRGVLASLLGENLSVEGFGEQEMGHAAYINFLQGRAEEKVARIMRFPELKVKLRKGQYQASGTYEEFADGILATEGTIEMIIMKPEQNFKLVTMKFFPRLRVTPSEATTPNETLEI